MALYFRFKSARDFTSMPICGHFISVGELKDRIFESKIGRGKDFDLVITNAQTNEDYVDESVLIPVNTSVLVRRIPGWPRKPIVVAPIPVEDQPELKEEHECTQDNAKSGISILDSQEWDDFFSSASNSLGSSSTLTAVDDEDRKIKAVVDTPALESQKGTSACGGGAVVGRGRNIPPEGYVCRRCKVAGHFIQHCPTNGDPDYDVKKVKAPRGIPKSMLVANPDGLYVLGDGDVADLRPDEAAFKKEVEGMPSIQRSVVEIPPELHCKICNKVMEFAVITSKCCLDSFCDKCIRNYTISHSKCICGATNVLADHLIPNMTLRNTINRILESKNSTVEKINGSALQARGMKSYYPQPTGSSVGQSLASNKEAKVPYSVQSVVSNKVEELVLASLPNEESNVTSDVRKNEVSEASKMKKRKNEESEASKMKKRKNDDGPFASGDMQWFPAQNLAAGNYMTPMAYATAYNSYWNGGIQPGMVGFMTPGSYTGFVPYMSYGVGPVDMSFGVGLPQYQCSGQPIRGRSSEFEARKVVPKRKR